MKRALFNSGWFFAKGSGSSLQALFGADNTPPTPVSLPHDAVIGTERKDFPIGGGTGFYESENIHYTKTFNLTAEDSGKVVWLEFEGVYQNGYIYINNAFAGRCVYGYGNYYIDATRFVKFGAENNIKVVVKNGVPSGRWYTGGGIYRDVRIMIGGPLHIKCQGTKISTPDIGQGLAVVRTVTPIEYVGSENMDVFVRNEILDASGNLVAENEAPVTVFANESKELRQHLTVRNPTLWDVDSPYLYTCRTQLLVGGEVVDEDTNTFGIRKLQLDPFNGLRLNGKTVKLRGGCIHHDNGVIGAATYADAEKRRVRIMREAGYNAIRSAHNPISKALLDACDELGMLVMDEFSDVWTTAKVDFDYGFHFDRNWEEDLINLVDKDYNHPSVIMYSIGNEIPETGNKFDTDWGKKLADKIRELDDTRYTTNSLNLMLAAMGSLDEIMASMGVSADAVGGEPMEINTMMAQMKDMMALLSGHEITTKITAESCAQVDIAGYNYAAERYEPDGERFPNRILVGSETTPPALDTNWALVEKLPYVLGDFCWTGWDYLGEAGIGKVTYGETTDSGFYGNWPWRIAYCGTIDIIGDMRPIAYWRECIWHLSKAPYIAACPPQYYSQTPNPGMWAWSDAEHCWNWPGYEEKPIAIEVYTDADEVELFINGASFGKKKVGEERACLVKFDAVYQPGEVRAVAFKEGQVTESTLRSAKDDNTLSVKVDRNSMPAGEYALAYVDIRLTDADGVLNANSRKSVHIDVEGAGKLIGFGSGDPLSTENYWANDFMAFHGRAQAIIRAGVQAGDIKVTVSAEGCQPQIVNIKVD